MSGSITLSREVIKQAAAMLDLSQALLEKSYHHNRILGAYKELEAVLAAPQPVQSLSDVQKLQDAIQQALAYLAHSGQFSRSGAKSVLIKAPEDRICETDGHNDAIAKAQPQPVQPVVYWSNLLYDSAYSNP
jgi:hypothetical protein